MNCVNNLAILTSEILKFFKEGNSTAIFLNIKSAYDNVLYNIMIKKLINLDISPNILAFINNLISFRQVFCTAN